MGFPETIVQYDQPSFDMTAKVQGTVISLSGKTVTFVFTTPTGNTKSRSCTLLSPANGTFRLTFASNDLDEPGSYSGRFKIVDATGKPTHSRKRFFFNVEETI